MARKYNININGTPVKATGAEIKRSCTAFQWRIWSRTRHTAKSNSIPFDLLPTDFPKELPPTCPVIGTILTIDNLVVGRHHTDKPYTKDNFYICSRRAYNALNASLTPSEWTSLYDWVRS
jgi:hypothetical protein